MRSVKNCANYRATEQSVDQRNSGGSHMCAKGYRIFLILLLVAAIGGGAWYCYYASHNNHVPTEGTLVKS